MTYEQREDQLYHNLSIALQYLNLALKESEKMTDLYGQQEYGRNEDIMEAQQALKSIVQKF